MSGLAIQYSKEIAKELAKIAVVLPGEPVEVGQIIHFPFGRKGIWPFIKPAPLGGFNIITSLKELGIKVPTTKKDKEPDPYIFSSRKSVKINANFDIDGNLSSNAKASGNIEAKFEKDGAIYFAAIDCTRIDLSNLQKIKLDLEKHKNSIIWNDTFLVTSVTVARKALIMQSSTNSASLSISGDVKGLLTKDKVDISAKSDIGVKNFKESSLIKPWSPNVTVFMGLHRFTKKTFGFKPKTKFYSINSPFAQIEVEKIAGEIVNSPNDTFALEEVSAFELLNENDMKELTA